MGAHGQDDPFRLPAPLAVERLGRAAGAIPQGPLRDVYLEERVRSAEVLPLVRVLACAQREAVRGSADARILLHTFSSIVAAARLPAELQAAITTGAELVGEPTVATLLERQAANDAVAPRADRAKRGSLAEAGETLGRRKSLARTATGDLYLRILDDPHPDVVHNALLNPRATEKEAVRVAARRPVPPLVLEVVARSRFHNRPTVRRALVLNPDCPPKLAHRLVQLLPAIDLEIVVEAKDISDDVRRTARLLLASVQT